MAWLKTRPRIAASSDLERMTDLVRVSFQACWGLGDTSVANDSPLWAGVAAQLDMQIRAEAPPGRHRADD